MKIYTAKSILTKPSPSNNYEGTYQFAFSVFQNGRLTESGTEILTHDEAAKLLAYHVAEYTGILTASGRRKTNTFATVYLPRSTQPKRAAQLIYGDRVAAVRLT